MNTKFFSLQSRAKTTALKQPKELCSYSRTLDGYVYESEQVEQNLSYYYLPDSDVEKQIDLSGGFKNFKKIDEKDNLGDFAAFLNALMKYETSVQKKTSGDIVTFRGLMTKLLILPYNLSDSVDLNVVYYDGQYFIKSDDEIELKRREQQLQEVTNGEMQAKMEYSGYKFEAISMLPRPWSDCTRKVIESRNKKVVNNYDQFLSIIRTGIGKVRVILAGEIDGVWDYKPTDGKDPLAHYVELKTTKLINDERQIQNFERKLFKTWAQCFLMGVRRIIYGFRNENLILQNVEEFKTEEIPLLIKNNPLTDKVKHKISCTDALKWYGAALDWIVKEVPQDESKSWRLSYDPSSKTFSLSELMPDKNKKLRNGEILTEEFKLWRESLNSKMEE